MIEPLARVHEQLEAWLALISVQVLIPQQSMVGVNHASSNRHLDEAPERFTMTSHPKISTSVSRISDTNRVQLDREGAPSPYETAPFTSCTMINFFYFIHFGIYIVCCTIVIYATTCFSFFAIFSAMSNTQFLTTTINKQTKRIQL